MKNLANKIKGSDFIVTSEYLPKATSESGISDLVSSSVKDTVAVNVVKSIINDQL